MRSTKRAPGVVRSHKARAALNGFVSVFTRVNSIMAGRHIPTEFGHHHNDAVAWTDGKTIYFNMDSILAALIDAHDDEAFIRKMASIKGINYHELSHNLYTPRIHGETVQRHIGGTTGEKDGDFDSRIAYYMQEHGQQWFVSWNKLEDQRIERLWTTAYRPTVKYFNVMVMEWVVANAGNIGDAWHLIYGRKYLPAELRKMSRKAHVDKHGISYTEQIESVIEEFIAMVPTTNALMDKRFLDEYFRVVNHYHQLLESQFQVYTPNIDPAHTGPSQPGTPSRGIPQNTKQEELTDQAADNDDAAADDTDDDAEAPEPSSKGSKQDKKDKTAEEDSEASDGQSDDDEADDDDSYTGDDTSVTGSGASGDTDDDDLDRDFNDDDLEVEEYDINKPDDGKRGSGGENDGKKHLASSPADEFYDRAKAMLDEALDDDELLDDLYSDQESIAAASKRPESNKVILPRVKGYQTDIHDSDMPVSKKVEHGFRKIRYDAEPAWVPQQPQGRLNFDRVINADYGDFDVFDQWDEGREEEMSMEVVILLDQSGSMSQDMDAASRALWIIKRSLDANEIPVTVIGFSDRTYLIMDEGDRVSPVAYNVFATYGSTNPVEALRETAFKFSQSTHPNRLLIMITDGEVDYTAAQGTAAAVQQMNRMGVTTVLVGIGHRIGKRNDHGAQITANITDPMDLVGLVDNIAHSIMERR